MCPTCNGTRKVHDSESYSISFHPCPSCPPDNRDMYEKYPELMALVNEWDKESA